MLRTHSNYEGKVLNAARIRVVEERMRRAFPRKECLRLSREGEVSQVKKADCKEEKALADKTGKSGRAFICHIGSWGFIPSASFRINARKSSGQICTVDSSLW